MNTKLKVLLNASILFAIIFFVTYILVVIASFLGCCLNLTSFFYKEIVWILVVLAIIIFGICFYNNCYRKIKE